MGEVQDRYDRIAEGFAQRLTQLNEQGYDSASPCEGWSAFEVASHVIATHRRMRGMLDQLDDPDQVRANVPDPVKGDDLDALFAEARSSIQSAIEDPALSQQVMGGMFGEQSFESLVGRMLCCDTLLHTWDLARSIGADERLDPDAVVAGHRMLEGLGDAIRRPGGFGPAIDEPSDDPQTAFLRFAGRRD